MAKRGANFAGGGIEGLSEGFFGINVGRPSTMDEYSGRQLGRSAAGALALLLAAKGTIDTTMGSAVMGGSLTLEVTSGGTASIVAGPAFAVGATQAAAGFFEGGLGAIGLYNYNKLQPLDKPSGPPESPQSPLNPDTKPYTDTSPTEYEGGYEPSQQVRDHLDARAHGGPDTPGNIDLKSWESNSIKGGREGQLLRYEQYLRDHGMSEGDIKKVTANEWESIGKDVHGKATDPAELDKLPAATPPPPEP